ncbi:MAG: tetratricopeptide repeat protein [Candidatus Hydrogenedentota bacterium]
MNIVMSFILGAAAFSTTYDDGMLAYSNENFVESVERFEELVYNRVYEPEVFYNLGNAYYRRGYLAPAIANYERALMLDPGLDIARENLRRTVVRTDQGLPRPAGSGVEQAVYFWHGGLTKSASMTLTFLFWIAGWSILALRVWKSNPYIRRVAAVSLLLAVLFMGSWVLKANPPELAVANGNKIPVRYGMEPSDTVRFELFEGDRVHIDERIGDWIRVVTADGERGWAREEYFIAVWPPYGAYGSRMLIGEDG